VTRNHNIVIQGGGVRLSCGRVLPSRQGGNGWPDKPGHDVEVQSSCPASLRHFSLAGVLTVPPSKVANSICEVAVDLLDLADIVFRPCRRGSRIDDIGPRGLSHFMALHRLVSASPSFFPVFFSPRRSGGFVVAAHAMSRART